MRVEHLLEQSARRFPGKTAVICAGGRHTYAEIDVRATRLAQTLRSGGLRSGDRVAILTENSVEAVISLFATLKAGGAFVMINPQIRSARLAELLDDSGARALVTRHHASGEIEVAWQRPRANAAPATPELAALVYTSGSTGRPKGVMLSHRNMTVAAASICTYLENRPDDVILNVLPLAFTYGLGQVTTAFHTGATVVLEQSFAYPQAILQTIVREQVTGFALVPTIATLLVQQSAGRRRMPALRYITNAAAALPIAKIRRLRQLFPSARIYSMYGQTECQRVSYLPPDLIDVRPSSVGIAIPGTELFVVDDQGTRAAPGVSGELVVQGPHVMLGYWNQPEETARVLRRGPRPDERVLYTGDLAYIDEEGLLYFVGRKDDIIKTRGEKVAPREVEDVIAQLPGVADVAVYGVPDDLLGEAIAAVVTLEPGASLDVERVRRHCLEHLLAVMVPRRVEFRKALPTTMSGKVIRRALREPAGRDGAIV